MYVGMYAYSMDTSIHIYIYIYIYTYILIFKVHTTNLHMLHIQP